jgi:dTDP-4-dehydrorhamnose 3,5-epimerase-like enzyme
MSIVKPILIEGGLAVDDRGQVSFVNDYNFEGVKRFYMVSNHQQHFVRAWHGHKLESKYVMVVSGVAIVAAVAIDDWQSPARDLEIHRYVLSANRPSVLFIPAGYANGFKTLTADTKIMFFSTATLEESKGDDYRFDAYYWNPWEVAPR